jgi:hypothetical protein
MEMIPTEANRQKDLSAGKMVVPPRAKATTSVMEVMVMATPECVMTMPNLSTWRQRHKTLSSASMTPRRK